MDLFNNKNFENTYVLLCIISVAAVVLLLKVLPLIVFKKKIKNQFVNSFLAYIPYAVLACLTFPEILFSIDHGHTTMALVSAAVGFVTAFIISYKEKGLLLAVVIPTIISYGVGELIRYFHLL